METLNKISWTIDRHPQEAGEFVGEKDITIVKLSDELKNKIVLPGRNFSIIYPASRYGEKEIREYYNTGGQPLTTNDLLYTIYTFYQRPVTEEEIQKWDFPEDAETLAEAMEALVFFEGLDQISPDVYLLRLGS